MCDMALLVVLSGICIMVRVRVKMSNLGVWGRFACFFFTFYVLFDGKGQVIASGGFILLLCVLF